MDWSWREIGGRCALVFIQCFAMQLNPLSVKFALILWEGRSQVLPRKIIHVFQITHPCTFFSRIIGTFIQIDCLLVIYLIASVMND